MTRKISVLLRLERLLSLHACNPRPPKLILHCWITWKFRTLGVSTSITLALLMICSSFIQSGLVPGRKDTKEGRQWLFFTGVDPVNEPQQDEPCDVTQPRQVPYRTRRKLYQNTVFWFNLRSTQTKRLAFWQTRSNAIILYNSLQPTVLKKWSIPELKQFCIRTLIYRLVCHQMLSWWMSGKFDTKIIINVEPVQVNLLQTRWKWNLKLYFRIQVLSHAAV